MSRYLLSVRYLSLSCFSLRKNFPGHSLFSLFTLTLFSFLTLALFCLADTASVYGQRSVDYSSFTQAYFDSVRATINLPANEEVYTIQAHRLAAVDEITIDGTLSEAAWQNAPRAGGLLEKEPFPLVAMSEHTEFAILYDDENLYIGVWCWDTEPDKVIRGSLREGHTALTISCFFWIPITIAGLDTNLWFLPQVFKMMSCAMTIQSVTATGTVSGSQPDPLTSTDGTQR